MQLCMVAVYTYWRSIFQILVKFNNEIKRLLKRLFHFINTPYIDGLLPKISKCKSLTNNYCTRCLKVNMNGSVHILYMFPFSTMPTSVFVQYFVCKSLQILGFRPYTNYRLGSNCHCDTVPSTVLSGRLQA